MESKTKKLINVLNLLIPILEKEENYYWTKWMKRARRLILKSDFTGVENIIGAYRGVGSFNDLVIGYANKKENLMEKENQKQLNSRLNSLRSEVYEISLKIKSDFKKL